jgi:hypothetical protein
MTTESLLLRAYRLLRDGKAHGVETADGRTIIGSFFDYQSPENDPDEIGYVAIERRNGSVELAYANEITGIVE